MELLFQVDVRIYWVCICCLGTNAYVVDVQIHVLT